MPAVHQRRTFPQERSVFGLTMLHPSHPAVRRLQQATTRPALHGHKVWPTSFVLLDYLVAYPLAADNVLRPLPCPLIGGNQPVMRIRNRFSRPRPALLACNGTHLGRSTLQCSTPAGS
jgi:hypothetical protein